MPTTTPKKRTSKPGAFTPTRSLLGSPSDSDLTLYKASDLTVLTHIQRKPSTQRLAQMGTAWDTDLEGILFVAHITDGKHAGFLHVYDGGTRWLAQMEHGDEDHIFICWVKDMTEKEAAQAFIAFNTMASRPHAFYQYTVGVEADTPWALGIQYAIEDLGLHVGQHSTTDTVACVTAMKRIVTDAYRKATRTDTDDAWADAGYHLEHTLRIARLMQDDPNWPGGDCWHADFIQAISGVLLKNPNGIPNEQRWITTAGSRTASAWVLQAQATRNSVGGSTSRANFVRYLLVDTYNRGLRAERSKLDGGTPIIGD